jgi:hypothetical protein
MRSAATLIVGVLVLLSLILSAAVLFEPRGARSAWRTPRLETIGPIHLTPTW